MAWNPFSAIKAGLTAAKNTVTGAFGKAVELVTGRPAASTPKPSAKAPTPKAAAPKPSSKPTPKPTPAAAPLAAASKAADAILSQASRDAIAAYQATKRAAGVAPAKVAPVAKTTAKGGSLALSSKDLTAYNRVIADLTNARKYGRKASVNALAKQHGIPVRHVYKYGAQQGDLTKTGARWDLPDQGGALASGGRGLCRVQFTDENGQRQWATLDGANASKLSQWSHEAASVKAGDPTASLSRFGGSAGQITDANGNVYQLPSSDRDFLGNPTRYTVEFYVEDDIDIDVDIAA